jgi:hypothetical protein
VLAAVPRGDQREREDRTGAAVDNEPTLSAGEETGLALDGYRDAMTYVLHVAQDPAARVDEGLSNRFTS